MIDFLASFEIKLKLNAIEVLKIVSTFQSVAFKNKLKTRFVL